MKLNPQKTQNKGADRYDDYPLSNLTQKIIGGAIEVHKTLGPGFKELAYENALIKELENNSMKYIRQKPIDVIYKGAKICNHRIDLIIEDSVIVELKVVKNFIANDIKRLLSF